MKILNKTLLAGILFASALLSGCSDDEYTPGEASNANGINVYFESPVSAEVALGPDDTAFTITVGRNQTDGALSVPLKMASVYANLFEVPAQVDFAQGESSKTLTIKVSSDMAMFESYPMTLTIDPAYTQAYTQSDLYPRLELNVIKEDYVPYADGKFSDYFMSPDENPIITDQEMEYSAILDMYRLKACWGTGTGSIVFAWDGSEKVTLQSSSFATGINDATYGAVTVSLAEDATYDEASKTFTFPLEFLVSEGTFGVLYESYTITSQK